MVFHPNYLKLGLKQFRADGCLSYLVFDPQERIGAIIDPSMEMLDDYRDCLADRGIKLKWVLDTHTHADHLSASHLLRSHYGAEIGMSSQSQSKRITRPLNAEDRLDLGSLELRVLATPGHTPDSLCFEIQGIAFTGDTLLIGATGRTDFPGSDPGELWRSLHEVLGKLPAETLVFPAHDYNQLICSTIGAEAVRNVQWGISSVSEFLSFKQDEVLAAAGGDIQKQLLFNLAANPAAEGNDPGRSSTACGAGLEAPGRFTTISVEKFFPKIIEKSNISLFNNHLFIDVRERSEFEAGHIPGSENIPLSEIGFYLKELLSAPRVYFSCLSGRRSAMAAQTVSYLGLADAVNVTGGFKAWSQAGYPTVKSPDA